MISNRFDRKSSTFGYILAAALASIVLLASAGLAVAQDPSTDRDNPTPVTSGEIKGDGVDAKTEYFYSFTGGPGEVTVTLDVKSDKAAAVSSVDLELVDARSKSLLKSYANPSLGDSKRAVETVKVRGKQTLLLRVVVSQGVDNFRVRISGAAEFAQPVPAQTDQPQPANTATPQPTPPPTPPAEMATGQTDAQTPADAQPATNDAGSGSATPATDASTQSNATDASPVNAATPTNSSKSRAQKAQSAIDSASSTSGSILNMIGSTKESLKGMKASMKGTRAPAANADGSTAAAQKDPALQNKIAVLQKRPAPAIPSTSSSNPGPVSTDGLPDLVIERFKLLDPGSGDVSVLVRNIGTGNAGASKLRLIVWEAGQFEHKQAKQVFVKVRPLAPRQWAVVRAKAGVPIINTKYSMFIDVGEEVKERNENNNRAEGEAGNYKP